MKNVRSVFAALLLVSATQAQASTTWNITSSSWTQSNEQKYESFVEAIGSTNCSTLESCLTSSANPYYAGGSEDNLFSEVPFDCAKLPYILRSYFAWKNGLPFSYVSSVSPNGDVGPSGDERYSQYGNHVTGREVIHSGSNAIEDIMTIAETVSTAVFRVPPTEDEGSTHFSDFYSPALNREQIRPGTSIYDPNGHVAVVYKVEADGRVLFMDSHPDRSLTRGTYGEKFIRSRPAAGAGFKNWRPVNYSSNPPHGSMNADISGYSTEQFFGTQPSPDGNWSAGAFVFNGRTMDYYDYLRNVLANGQLQYNPVNEVTNMMRALCSDLKDRIKSVDAAVAAGMPNQSHPSNLPQNIYGTTGDWESYASPSRDARLRSSYRELRTRTEQMVTLARQHSPLIEYSGDAAALVRDLVKIYDRESGACTISYAKSNGNSQSVNFDQIRQRVYDLSFDPYHCPELRWGAHGSELNSCDGDSNKMAWYKGEARLRNQIDRDYNATMGFSLDQLLSPNPPPGDGTDVRADVDTRGYLSKSGIELGL